jgi:hypothetical protein
MSSFSEYGDFGTEVVLVVVVVVVLVVFVDVVDEAASASCMLGTTASEKIRMTTRSDRDFMKTLEAASRRY